MDDFLWISLIYFLGYIEYIFKMYLLNNINMKEKIWCFTGLDLLCDKYVTYKF